MKSSDLRPRIVDISAAQKVISLMNSNRYDNWDRNLYNYYYKDYPLRSFQYGLFDQENNIRGFIGFLEVDFSVSGVNVAWGMHALIDIKYRNLLNFIALVEFAQTDLRKNQKIDFLIGMPNQSAEKLYLNCLGWSLVSYINFSFGQDTNSLSTATDRKFFIKKNNDWWNWRLSLDAVPKLVYHHYNHDGVDVIQILHSKETVLPRNQLPGGVPICTWDHCNYSLVRGPWSCTFLLKQLTNKLTEDIHASSFWHLDMIDSDAFKPKNFTCVY